MARDLVERGERMTEDRVALTPALLAEDALIFGLRMNAGVDLAPWRARWPDAPWATVEAVLDAGERMGCRARRRPRAADRSRATAGGFGRRRNHGGVFENENGIPA